MTKKKKKSSNKKEWLKRLMNSEDHSVSVTTVFLFITSGVSILLLLVPAVALLIEVCYNHTITTDLTGMAAYIGSVAAIFASGGLLKGWTSYANNKFSNKETKEVVKKLSNAVLKKLIDSIDASIQEEKAPDMYDNIENKMEEGEEEFDPNAEDNG